MNSPTNTNAECQLRTLRERVSAIGATLPDVVWSVSIPSHEVLYVSQAAESVFGKPAEDLCLGFHEWSSLLHPEDRERVLASWNATARGDAFEATYRIVTPQGRLRWIESRARAALDANGKVVRIDGMARDITERRAQAHRIEELEAAKDALAGAKEEAERASLAKSAFLARVSHEIRTPMNGLLGALELLAQSGLSSQDAVLVAGARDSGNSLLALLNDVLDMARIEAGRVEIATGPVSLRALLEGVLATHRANGQRKGLAIGVHIDAALPEWVIADDIHLGQILGNLVSNAIKFTDKGSVRLEAVSVPEREKPPRIRFRVVDTGCGIEQATLRRLFRPFERGCGTGMSESRGAGLGLAICRGLSDRLGATLAIESVPGAGTIATLELGAAPCEPPRPIGQRSCDLGAQGALVLVVEDHPTNRMVLARQLAMLGCIAQVCESGEEALQRFEPGTHELVITDCEMPGMDGYALTRAIRAGELAGGGPRTPIVAWSAHPYAEIAARCTEAGADAVLQKPLLLADLAAALVAVLPQALKFDAAQLARIAGTDERFQREALAQFRAGCIADTARLRHAIEAHDRSEAAHLAHRIRGSARMVGANRLAGASELLEHASRAGDWTRVAAAFPMFERVLKEILADVDNA